MWGDSLQQPLIWSSSLFLGGVWLSRLLAVALNMRKIPEITRPEFDATPVDTAGHVPSVSIVVPARNEAEHIEAALLSLLQLDYPDYEVIAVDDRSDDATGAILDRLQVQWRERAESLHHLLKVLHVEDLPQGWLGKTHAMWCAANQASGDWILFTDADVVFRQDAVRRAVVYAEREGADHLVLFPTMVMKSAGERMMMAFFQSQFVFAHRPWKVADPKSRDSIGVGAFNLVRRRVYEQLGTYQRLRMAILDDMKLGEAVKRDGYRQRCVFGRDLLRLRWVFGTLGMVRNLTKNFFAILHYNAAFATLAICGILFVNLGPFVGVWLGSGWTHAGYVVALLTLLLIYFGMSRRSDISPVYVLLHPIGTLLFGYAVARSVVVTLVHGGVVWRGTRYPLAELRKFDNEEPRWSWL
jgi:glycosyltransferase involved in cell wall biosynthesis